MSYMLTMLKIMDLTLAYTKFTYISYCVPKGKYREDETKSKNIKSITIYNGELATTFMYVFYCSSCTFHERYFRGFTALRSLGLLIKTFQCVCLLYKTAEI